MSKIIIGVVIVAAVAGYLLMRQNPQAAEEAMDHRADMAKDTVVEAGQKAVDMATGAATQVAVDAAKKMNAPVKEFAMTSYYDDKGVWFSVKEIKVKKGDLVRVKVTNTKGNHDFTLDEFGIKSETPLNQEVVIEFVADKTGTFEYYCSKPNHRAKGQWGKLIVE